MPAERWGDRRWLSVVLRIVIFLIPVAAAVITGMLVSRALPEPTTVAGVLGWWAVMITTSGTAMWLTDRAARRMLPLAVLFRLTLVFPDQAPSRLRILRRIGSTKRLEERLEEAKETGAEDDLTEAAENILALVSALSKHDRLTRGHAERVRAYTDLLADELHVSDADKDRLRWAALLHDIGKLTVHPDILNKPGKPDEEEWKILKSHPAEGEKIIAPLVEWLGKWATAVVEHHEKYDGTGYPRGLAGDEISYAARMVAVADVYDTITSARSYKSAMSAEAARQELARSAGSHLDPTIVRAFMNVSIGKICWIVGPAAWLSQLPFIGGLERIARDLATVGSATAAVAALVVGGVIGAPRTFAVEPPDTTIAAVTTTVPEPPETTVIANPPETTAPPETTTTTLPPTTVPVDQAPIAAADLVTGEEDQALVIDVLANDSDPEGGPLTLGFVDGISSAGGTVECALTECTYTPPPNLWGSDTFTYQVSDGVNVSTGTVTIELTQVNDAPNARADSSTTTSGTTALIYVLSNDSDAEGDERTITAYDATSESGGIVICSTFCSYTPPDGFTGSDSFRYTVSDGNGGVDSATVTITVNA